jgi:hypothetical protein
LAKLDISINGTILSKIWPFTLVEWPKRTGDDLVVNIFGFLPTTYFWLTC